MMILVPPDPCMWGLVTTIGIPPLKKILPTLLGMIILFHQKHKGI